jgi:hypothetical protein
MWRKLPGPLVARFREPEVSQQVVSQVFILTLYHLLTLPTQDNAGVVVKTLTSKLAS